MLLHCLSILWMIVRASKTATFGKQHVFIILPIFQEDLLATLMGIDLLVQQRQRLIEGLVERHGQMTRRNEIGKLAQFSKDIDAIIK